MNTILASHQLQSEDKRIINNLADAFQDNDRMRALLGNRSGSFSKRITQIISYSYFMVKKIGGVFIFLLKRARILICLINRIQH